MREKYLWLAIAILTALTLGQACYIYEQKASAIEISDPPPVQPKIKQMAYADKASEAQAEELEKWRKKVREQINQGGALLETDFDSYFNDRFFSGRPDPFADIQRVHSQMSSEFGNGKKTLFDGYWNKWFEQRLMPGQFNLDTATTDSDVTLTLRVPGLKTADVDITKERIKIFLTTNASPEGKSGEALIKKTPPQSYIKILPIPADAVPVTGKARIEGDLIKIRFDRKR